MSPTSLKLTFPGGAGDMLAARLELPAEEPRAFALFAHCFTCSKDAAAASRVSRALGAHGFAVLRFDFTGLGNSDGDFANTSFSANQDDLVAAADYLRGAFEAPALLVGHSLGGTAVLRAAERINEVRALVTIAAPSDPVHLKRLLAPAAAEAARAGEALLELGGRQFKVKSSFFEDLERHPLEAGLARKGRALLVLHSPVDKVVDIKEARRIFEAAAHPKSFVALDGADHLLGKKEDAEYAAAMIATWAERYVQRRHTPSPEEEAREGRVRVREVEHLTQRILAGGHVLVADEPAASGGQDAGPTPYDLLLAALGACTSMTLRLYADKKGWPLAGVDVRLRHDRIHAEDCATCDTDAGGYADRFEREIALAGELDADQRARLLEIADRCPVHRTLMGQKEIVTRLADGQAD